MYKILRRIDRVFSTENAEGIELHKKKSTPEITSVKLIILSDLCVKSLKIIIRRYHQVHYHPAHGHVQPDGVCPPHDLAVLLHLHVQSPVK